jgi:hypothetical protein
MELLVKPEILTSYIIIIIIIIYGAPCKARNFNVIYIHGPTFGNAESRLFLFAAQLCVNTLLATKATLITDGI